MAHLPDGSREHVFPRNLAMESHGRSPVVDLLQIHFFRARGVQKIESTEELQKKIPKEEKSARRNISI
jgi:hypothetical protein